jgi:AAHS family 4-hydroxybenzoate transporter-like MFS transporter
LGFEISQASWSTAGFQLGGILGAISLGLLADRLDSIRVVVAAYLAAAAIIVAIAFAQGPSIMALAALGAGFMVVGAQSCNNAMVASLYPTVSRGKALGSNLTIARIGSILGPTITGWLLLLHVPPQRVLMWAAVPAAIAAVLLLVAANSIRKLTDRQRLSGL